MKTPDFSDTALHRKWGVELYNYCWTLLEKTGRTQLENDELERAAFASLFHWSKAGDASHLSVGEWMVAHVMTVLERPDSALAHGHRCLEITEGGEFGGWRLAFAHEALARAYALAGELGEARHHYDAARSLADQLEDEDKKVFDDQFAQGPWFGLA